MLSPGPGIWGCQHLLPKGACENGIKISLCRESAGTIREMQPLSWRQMGSTLLSGQLSLKSHSSGVLCAVHRAMEATPPEGSWGPATSHLKPRVCSGIIIAQQTLMGVSLVFEALRAVSWACDR